jgi:mRNA interferase RelE/StbE
MASFSVEVSATAEKQIRKLQRPDRIRVLRAIQGLADDPRPSGCRRLAGVDDVWRIRVGVVRVIYSVVDRALIVIVLKVGHRKDVYR